jgi:hypothetical protein
MPRNFLRDIDIDRSLNLVSLLKMTRRTISRSRLLYPHFGMTPKTLFMVGPHEPCSKRATGIERLAMAATTLRWCFRRRTIVVASLAQSARIRMKVPGYFIIFDIF